MATTLEILLTAQDRATREIQGLQRQVTALNTAVGANAPAADRAAAANARLAQAFRGASAAGGVLFSTLTALGGIVLFADAIRTIASFEQSFAGVRAVIQGTEEEFIALEDAARDLGATTVFSATQAAQGLEFLGRAGFDAQEALGAIEGTLNLAAAGGLELGRAADIASNVLSGFGLAASEAGRVADILAASAANANTNVEQLGEGIKFVGPIAAAFGIDVADASAALGTLSNAGLQASTAGTGLRRVLSTLGTPSAKLTQLLDRLGLEFGQVNPATNELTEVIDRLSETSLSASDALEVFGDRGAPAILALVNQRQGLVELTETLQNSGGEAERIADTLQDTLAGSVRELRSAFDELILQLGDAGLGNTLRDIVEGVTGVIRVFTNSLDPLDENAALYRQIAAAVESLQFVLVSLVATRVVGFLGGIGTALNGLRLNFVAARGAAITFRTTLIGLRTVVLGALGPLGWIVGLGLALASFADNEAVETADALAEIEERLKAVREEAQALSTQELEIQVGEARSDIAELTGDLETLNRRLEGVQPGRSAARKRSLIQEEIDATQADLDVAEATVRELETILDASRQRDRENAERNNRELTRLREDRNRAQLDAAVQARALQEAQLENELELAKQTADEILATETALLDQQLENREISVEDYYRRLQELQLNALDTETAIAQRALDEQVRLQEQALQDIEDARRGAIAQQQAQEGQPGVAAEDIEQRIAIINETFAAERRAREAAQAQERIDNETNLRELAEQRRQIIEENNLAELEAINRRNTELQREQDRADKEALDKAKDEFDRRFQLIVDQNERLRRQAEQDVITGAESSFGLADTLEGIDEESVRQLEQLKNDVIEFNQNIGSDELKDRVVELGDTIDTFADRASANIRRVQDDLANGLGDALFEIVDGSKSASEAFSDFARNFLREIARMILKQIAFNAVRAAGRAFGFGLSDGGAVGASGGGAIGFAEGGIVSGPGGPKGDKIPARLSSGEYVVQAQAVRHYGLDFLENLNRMALAQQTNLKRFSITRPRRMKFQEGGVVEGSTGTEAASAPQNNLRLVNVVDTNEAANYLNSSDGESVIVNIIRRNGSQIKSLLR